MLYLGDRNPNYCLFKPLSGQLRKRIGLSLPFQAGAWVTQIQPCVGFEWRQEEYNIYCRVETQQQICFQLMEGERCQSTTKELQCGKELGVNSEMWRPRGRRLKFQSSHASRKARRLVRCNSKFKAQESQGSKTGFRPIVECSVFAFACQNLLPPTPFHL